MISLGTVTRKGMEPVLEIFIESILQRTKLIDEVIIVNASSEGSEEINFEQRNIKFRKVNCNFNTHAEGLHECIDRATNEYLMLSDPDIFFSSAIDELYISLLEQYALNVVGVSHHAANNQSYLYFPCVMNMLVKKSQLPDADFLRGHCRARPSILRAKPPAIEPAEEVLDLVEGKYLVTGPIEKYIDVFPNKDINCHFDVGCNLYLWAVQQKWRWLAFQTLDCHWYRTTYFRSNVKELKVPPKQKLLYHYTSGATRNPENFKIAWEADKNND
jgi:hypothetical protein